MTIKSSSGFHGKGFKFDENEAQLVSDRKKLQKAALGLADSDDEDPSADVRLHFGLMCFCMADIYGLLFYAHSLKNPWTSSILIVRLTICWSVILSHLH